MDYGDATRLWWLIRANDQSSSYVLTAYVKIEHDTEGDQPIYESTIAGLENRIFGAGETAREAEINAMRLLGDMLEVALKQGSFEKCFADAKGFGAELNAVPFDKMVDTLKSVVMASTGKAGDAQKQRPFLEAPGMRAEPLTRELAESCK